MLRVMISSTVFDLIEHRKALLDACLRQGMHPEMMEHLPALDDSAVEASYRLIDKADIFIGAYGCRYGHIPTGQERSIVELEYDYAVRRGLPRLLFVMDEREHPVRPIDVETGVHVERLRAFRDRIQRERVVSIFRSAEHLRGEVINALSLQRDSKLGEVHYIADTPTPPEAWIAHPYTLLHSDELVGRQQEQELLTDWVSSPDSVMYQSHVLCIVGIGGMGKSALTWKWFSDIAPQEMPNLRGLLWWSFYESDVRELRYAGALLRRGHVAPGGRNTATFRSRGAAAPPPRRARLPRRARWAGENHEGI